MKQDKGRREKVANAKVKETKEDEPPQTIEVSG